MLQFTRSAFNRRLKEGATLTMDHPTPFARTPAPPYYAVVFSSRRRDGDGDDGYERVAQRMLELASSQPGFLGVESARDNTGFGITVSYWASLEAIRAWKAELEHQAAQELGRKRWYEHYEVRVARVERAYDFDADQG